MSHEFSLGMELEFELGSVSSGYKLSQTESSEIVRSSSTAFEQFQTTTTKNMCKKRYIYQWVFTMDHRRRTG
eukprot:UN07610